MRTTTIGLLLAMLTALQPYLNSGAIDFEANWFQYLIAIAIGALGYFAKDPVTLSSYREEDSDIGGGGIKNPKP